MNESLATRVKVNNWTVMTLDILTTPRYRSYSGVVDQQKMDSTIFHVLLFDYILEKL